MEAADRVENIRTARLSAIGTKKRPIITGGIQHIRKVPDSYTIAPDIFVIDANTVVVFLAVPGCCAIKCCMSALSWSYRNFESVNHKKFIEGDDDSFARFGVYMYVACAQDDDGNCYALAAPDIARRARNSVGETRDYNLLSENCHMFTEYCINGKRDGNGILSSVVLALWDKFNLTASNPHRLLDMWRSTGITADD